MLLALKSLRRPYTHVFSIDVSQACRDTMRFNYGDTFTLYQDATRRNVGKMPKVDLYRAGFPCQPYSTQGVHGGLGDPRGGQVLASILAYVKRHRPNLVILENVKGLVTQRSEVLNSLAQVLSSYNYDVHWKVLNAKDFGVAGGPRIPKAYP